jgi:hypothetical protein
LIRADDLHLVPVLRFETHGFAIDKLCLLSAAGAIVVTHIIRDPTPHQALLRAGGPVHDGKVLLDQLSRLPLTYVQGSIHGMSDAEILGGKVDYELGDPGDKISVDGAQRHASIT